MLCILCLSGSDRMLQIFSQRGINLDISNIITKHFWLKPNPELENSKFICRSCWDTVDVFHTFYKSIEEAHTVFTACLKQTDTEIDNEEDISDLFTTVVKQEHPEETELKSKEIPLTEPVDGLIKSDEEKDIANESDESEPEELVVKLSPRSIKKNDDEKDESSGNESNWNDVSHNQDNEVQQNDTDSDSGSDYAAHKKKTKKITRSYNVSELRKKGIPQREFDGFIKKNMELVCSVCNKSLKNFFCLQQHFRKVHKQDGYVTCCDKQFTSRFSLVHHLFLHQDPDLFKCSLCSRVLANKRSFEYHMRCHEAAKATPTHKCEKCKKCFPSLPRLEKHLKTHVRKKSESICDQCGKVYNSAASLKCHLKRDHLGIVKPKERVQCQQCGVYLSDSYSLKFHIKHLHPEEKVIQSCHICGHISATAYGLKRHIQYMHTMERVHKCNICEDKAFKTAQRLREHMTTHTGEVLYTCPHCPKTFNSNANMHSHRKKMHRKEWEENRRHPHMGHSAQASVNNANANAIANATEENNQQ